MARKGKPAESLGLNKIKALKFCSSSSERESGYEKELKETIQS